MTGLTIFGLIGLSLGGLGYLSATDPKRRRIFGQSKVEHRPLLWPARLATFLPGVVFVVVGHWSGLTIWAGAVTTLGWAMVAVPPNRYREARALISKSLRHASERGGPFLSGFTKTTADATKYMWGQLTAGSKRLATAFAGFASTPSGSDADKIARLEARIADLEGRLNALETEPQSEINPPVEPEPFATKPRAVKNLDAAE